MQDDKAGTLRAEGENRPSRPSHVIGEPLAVDTFNQTLSPLNQTLRAGTDVDRMGGVLESREVIPTLTAKMQGSSGWAPYNETAHILPVIAPTVTTCKGSKGGSSSEAIDEIVALHQAEQANNPICSDITGTLTVGHGSSAGHPHRMGDHSFLVGDAVAFQPGNLRRKAGADPSTETFPTLKCDSGDQSPHVATFKWGNSAQAHTIGYSEQNSPTLTAGGGGNMIPAVMHPSQGVDLFNGTLTGDLHVPLRTAQGHGAPAAIAPTLTASNDPSRSPQSSEVTQQVSAVHQVTMAVRRLTPRECERLQGFPDDWSQIPWKGKPAEECPDGPRYKACGNSMAVPVMRWIGSRINAKHKELYG
jgi:DNA (cytosine-5)-methyltransferase 1